MYIALLFLPFLTFLVVGGLGRYIGRVGSVVIGNLGIGFTALGFWYLVLNQVGVTWVIGAIWLETGLVWSFVFDAITLEMGLLITTITFCVILYSLEYMWHDPHVIRFVAYLTLFAFFMLVLVTAGTLVQMFVGWEGVGLVSFLLINFWFTRLEANRSALKAMIFNRIGDSFYLVAIAGVLLMWGTSDVLIINKLNVMESSQQSIVLASIYIGLFLAMVGKSAQLGLHAWLPDAMEGPTPVSALLHSATMVTAGVFLLVRFAPLLSVNKFLMTGMVWLGLVTALINSVFGFFQWDLKKIIAFSTCSQLGLMVVAVGYDTQVGFYHLVNHGFFKALLFLSAGAVIHAVGDEQDIRKMGGLHKYLPFTALCMLVGSGSLIGFPFLSGFYSKEWVMFYTLVAGGSWFWGVLVYTIVALTSLFTVLYSIKIMYFTFWSTFWRGGRLTFFAVSDPQLYMAMSMFLIALFSIVFGCCAEEFFWGVGQERWFVVLGIPLTQLSSTFSVELLSITHKWFLINCFILGVIRFYGVRRRRQAIRIWLSNKGGVLLGVLFWMVANRLGFISFYRLFAKGVLAIGYQTTFRLLDRGLFEKFGPTQLVVFLSKQRQGAFTGRYVKFSNILWLFMCSVLVGLIGLNNYGYTLIFGLGLYLLNRWFYRS